VGQAKSGIQVLSGHREAVIQTASRNGIMTTETISTAKTKAHTVYTVDGVRVPGVTTITGQLDKSAQLVKWANNLGLQGIDSSKYTDEAASIGTLAHYLILCHLKKETPVLVDYTPKQLDTAETALIKFWDWQKEHTLEPDYLEIPVVSKTLMVGGTADFIGKVDGVKGIVDFKTGKAIYDDYFIQVAGYAEIVKDALDYQCESYRILRIGRDDMEGFEEKRINNIAPYRKVFLTLVQLYYDRKELKGGL